LITGRTQNIGVIVPDLDNPFYPGVIRGVHARARQAGYSVLLADSDEDPATEIGLVHTMARQVDGLIVIAPFSSDEQIAQLVSVTPLVLVNRRLPGIPAVLMDTARAMRQVVNHLVALGHRRCGYLNGPSNAWSNHERRRGLLAAVKSHGVEVFEFGPYEPKFEGGQQGTDAALREGLTAILAFNDLMALGVLSRLRELNVHVPAQVSVVGFDDVLYAAMCSPPLTTVAMPMLGAGKAAVDLLLRAHAGTDLTQNEISDYPELTPDLIVRSTTAPPPTKAIRLKHNAHGAADHPSGSRPRS
jgi:DNA-binding LacI/PurR family transcriptional regulator